MQNFLSALPELVGNDIKTQTEQVMHNISAVLAASNGDFGNVVKTTCFLADINDFAEFNTVYAKYFTGKPARSCVAVSALPKGALVEVEVLAVVKKFSIHNFAWICNFYPAKLCFLCFG